MFPRLEYDLPILSFDMVGKGGGPISLAVIDLCPVSLNRSLPPQYYATVRWGVMPSADRTLGWQPLLQWRCRTEIWCLDRYRDSACNPLAAR